MAGFADQVRRWGDRTERKLELVARKVALDAFGRVVERTPVDTGRAKGNWIPAVNRMPTESSAVTDPAGAATQAKIAAAVAVFAAGDVIFLVNNLPYIRKLENGHSQQAPAGMVAITVAEFRGIVSAAVAQARTG